MQPNLTITPAQSEDGSAILTIIDHAKAFLKAAGSSQWQSGYPNATTITTDITNKAGWVLKVDGQVAGYAAVIVGIDPNYQSIDGAWQNDTAPYATIHRIAVSNQYRGQHLGLHFFELIINHFLAEGIRNFRVDTFKLNRPMQHIAKSAGFAYRGVIEVEDPIDPTRLAFELNK
ncbi:MAG: GNAT family N-acetyltransferase [Limosilactobacillus gorillae]|uniref:GNAT family N-acetyltransferase n=1 Tax=Limosilactobacillus gorillae TaxID=1450649 RepID=UPI000AE0459A|nr:GNAT family N-acetyltransferase [Limosilactobacillus gorillae]MDO4855090.1 GNAT family N-acetyltransferase [Limosilactobacillus gorillae]